MSQETLGQWHLDDVLIAGLLGDKDVGTRVWVNSTTLQLVRLANWKDGTMWSDGQTSHRRDFRLGLVTLPV